MPSFLHCATPRRGRLLLILLLLCLSLVYPLSAQSGPVLVVSDEVFATGRDLSIPCGGGLYLFGDTYNMTGTNGNGPSGMWIAPNSSTWTPLAIPLFWHDTALGARTVTPTGCARWGGRYLARYMEIASNEGHDFTAVGSGIAVSTDGETWQKHLLWHGDGPQTQATLVVSGGVLYALSTEAGRTGAAYLARATGDPTRVEAWQFWNGTAYGGGVESAVAVIPGAVGETSLCYDGAWKVLYMSPAHSGIVLRSAPMLRGPWSEAVVVHWWNNPDDPAWGRYSPQFIDGNCRDVLVTDFQPYSVFRARLEG